MVPNNVPDHYKEKLTIFIRYIGGIFGTMYYKPLRARIVDPVKVITLFIVNLENGEICVPKKGVRYGIGGNLTLDGFFEKRE